ncbi:MAG TPA: CHAD domain-containing protein [Thermoanaerobaculia bacterium]|jgi:CHAD domain-containing protein|nr:CHAD domain-containing protein [Thermoanaerobaculia bacterium]
MTYQLHQRESLATGLRRVAVEQAAAAGEHLADVAAPAEAVHEARKRSKEARAALRLLRGAWGPELERSARAKFRDAAGTVSAIRDAEVTVEALEKLRRYQRLLRSEREAAERVLSERRDAADAAVTAAMRELLATSFAGAAQALPAVQLATPESVTESLARVYRRGKRRMKAAYANGEAADFHAWRKSTKDLWYAVRLFEPAWPGPLGTLAAAIHELSQLLGDEHDLTVLRDALAAAGGDPPLLTPRLQRAIARRQRRLRERAREAGNRLWAEKPRTFARRILDYWQGWHRTAR